MRTIIVLLFIFVLLLPSISEARRTAVVRAYLNSLGLKKTPPGCQVDHAISLRYGGKDEIGNLQLICGPTLEKKEHAERYPKEWEVYRRQCLP